MDGNNQDNLPNLPTHNPDIHRVAMSGREASGCKDGIASTVRVPVSSYRGFVGGENQAMNAHQRNDMTRC